MKILHWFLALVPAAIVAHVLHAPPAVTFLLAGGALIPLAGLLGEATEELASHLGERWGGFLNATFGNLGELLIAFVALKAGEIELVQLSIVGSVIGNLLIVLGASLVVGGIRHGELRFDAASVGPMITTLFLALTAMLVPTIAHHEQVGNMIEGRGVSVGVALLTLYALLLLYRFRKPKDAAVLSVAEIHETVGFRWSKRTALAVLAVSALAVGGVSEILVHHVDAAGHALGWSPFFIGLFIVPFVGNVAEHFVAIQAAARNRMDFSLEISVGSAAQIALFVFPVLLFASPFVGQPFTPVFPSIAIEATGAAVMAAWLVMLDGRSNWFEGAALLILCGLFGVFTF